MAVIDPNSNSNSNSNPNLNLNPYPNPNPNSNPSPSPSPSPHSTSGALSALRLAALALPGLVIVPGAGMAAQGTSGEVISFMHEHYAEGERDLQGLTSKFQPIEVESILGQARFNVTEEISATLNLSQDTWSGATPAAIAPSSAHGNRVTTHAHSHTTTGASIDHSGHLHDPENEPSPSTPQAQTLTGASPYLYSSLKLDSARRPLHTDVEGKVIGGVDNQLVHTL